MKKRKWWKDAVIYEIYPRSFADSNNDGIGDLMGIVDKLDYLQSLGINALWLCPVYETPNIDSGYDVADYYKIAKDLGTLENMEELIKEAHKRDIKIIMELVANHTSNEHYWFKDALEYGEYRDFYIWKNSSIPNKCPNNWMSSKTGQSVWSKVLEEDEEYYLHLYTEAQPDLNWSNKNLRQEIYKIMRYWFDKGIDGFRMDVINKIAKADGLPDVPAETPFLYGEMYFENYPKVHEYLREMYKEVLQYYPDCLAMGQTSGVSCEEALDYCDDSRDELNLFLQFEHVNIDYGSNNSKLVFNPKEFYDNIMKWQMSMNGKLWNTIFLGSHDLPRAVSHYGNADKYHRESATMLATFQLLLKGTQVIYYGEEIGMTNVNYDDIAYYIDTRSKSTYEHRVNVLHHNIHEVESDLRELARDNARYPMQWNDGKYAGFSRSKPWMKNGKFYAKINVEKQEGKGDSILEYYKWLIKFRNTNEVFLLGDIQPINDELPDNIFGYKRILDDIEYLIICNFSTKSEFIDGYEGSYMSNYDKLVIETSSRMIHPYEVKVIKSKK